MAKAITVKVATPKVIKALETKLATIEKEYSSQAANEAKYEKARNAWQKELTDYAIANIKKAENFRTNYRSYHKVINIDFDVAVSEKDLPTEPNRDYTQIPEWKYVEIKEEINNALNILRMTDEEYVNTSTMKSIAQYL
jgi:hypothetical protein